MNIDTTLYRAELQSRLTETFEKVEGFYLDRGTSLFETLASVSADEASTPNRANGETVAAHVYHLTFYLDVLREYTTGERTGKTDWGESWTVSTVTETEWGALKVDCRRAYDGVVRLIRTFDGDDAEDFVSGTLSLLAHSAFHLAAIRQILDGHRA